MAMETKYGAPKKNTQPRDPKLGMIGHFGETAAR